MIVLVLVATPKHNADHHMTSNLVVLLYVAKSGNSTVSPSSPSSLFALVLRALVKGCSPTMGYSKYVDDCGYTVHHERPDWRIRLHCWLDVSLQRTFHHSRQSTQAPMHCPQDHSLRNRSSGCQLPLQCLRWVLMITLKHNLPVAKHLKVCNNCIQNVRFNALSNARVHEHHDRPNVLHQDALVVIPPAMKQ